MIVGGVGTIGESGGGVITEIVSVRRGIYVQTRPGGGPPAEETVSVRRGRRTAAPSSGNWFETGIAQRGFRAGLSDVFIPFAGGNIYYEFPAVNTGRQAGGSFQFIGSASPGVSRGRRLAAAPELITDDQPASMRGIQAGGTDSRTYANDSVLASRGRQLSGAASLAGFETPAVSAGWQGGVSDEAVIFDSPLVRRGGRLADAATQTWEDSPALRRGRSAQLVPLAITVDFPSVRHGVQLSGVFALIGKESVVASAGHSAAMLEGRAYVELVSAKRGKRSTGPDVIVIVETAVCGRGYHAQVEPPVLDASGLIPAIRYHLAKTLPDLTQIAEALPDEETIHQLVKPYGIILAHEPVTEEFAVMDQGERVPVDILLVYEEEVAIDNPQLMRSDLHAVSLALLADYQQFGRSNNPSAINTERVATPMERANSYQQRFRDLKQPVAVMVLSMEFVCVESLVDA